MDFEVFKRFSDDTQRLLQDDEDNDIEARFQSKLVARNRSCKIK